MLQLSVFRGHLPLSRRREVERCHEQEAGLGNKNSLWVS